MSFERRPPITPAPLELPNYLPSEKGKKLVRVTWLQLLTHWVPLGKCLPSLSLIWKMPSCHMGVLQRPESVRALGCVSAGRRREGMTFRGSLG